MACKPTLWMYVYTALTRSRGEQANARPTWSLLQATYDEFIMVTEEVPLPEGAPEVDADDPVALLAAGRGQLVGRGCMRVYVWRRCGVLGSRSNEGLCVIGTETTDRGQHCWPTAVDAEWTPCSADVCMQWHHRV